MTVTKTLITCKLSISSAPQLLVLCSALLIAWNVKRRQKGWVWVVWVSEFGQLWVSESVKCHTNIAATWRGMQPDSRALHRCFPQISRDHLVVVSWDDFGDNFPKIFLSLLLPTYLLLVSICAKSFSNNQILTPELKISKKWRFRWSIYLSECQPCCKHFK